MDFGNLPDSTIGIVGAVILAVIGVLGKWLSGRMESNEDLEREIDEVEKALAIALENGMVTDAHRLSERLMKLRKRLGRRLTKSGATVSSVVAAVVSASVSAAVSGCASGVPEREYVVIGERIMILEPGTELVVPPLVPPAKRWYMVDDEGLKGWLGIARPAR